MRSHIVPVEVAGVGVGVIAHLASVGGSVLDTEAAYTDGVVGVEPHSAVVGV